MTAGSIFGAAGTSTGGLVASVFGEAAVGVWAEVMATRLRATAPGMNLRIIVLVEERESYAAFFDLSRTGFLTFSIFKSSGTWGFEFDLGVFFGELPIDRFRVFIFPPRPQNLCDQDSAVTAERLVIFRNKKTGTPCGIPV